MQMFKRIFSRTRPENVSKSIRCTDLMWQAITELANEVGESPNSYIVLVLDQHLQHAVKDGKIKFPEDVDPGKIAAS